MSEFVYDDEETDADEPKQNPVRARMKQLEKEAEELRKQVAEATQAKRELAFVKAGIDPADPAAKYFVKGYDGELEADAIRTAAVEARLIAPPNNQPTVDEQAAWNRSQRVVAGAQNMAPAVDWADRLEKASSPNEVEQIMAEIRAAQQSF